MRCKIVQGIITIFFTYLLCGCATVPQTAGPIEKYRDFNEPFNKVWTSTIEGLTRSGEIISFTEKDSGLIVLDKDVAGNEVGSLIRDSGLTTWHRGKVKASVYLKALSDQSTRVFVNVKMSGSGVPFLQKYPQEFILNSNGATESNYLNLVSSLINSGREFKALDTGYEKPTQNIETTVSKKQEEVRPSLGVIVKDISQDVSLALNVPQGKGVFVSKVSLDSIASKAGIKAGDIILAYDENDISNVSELSALVKKTSVDKAVKIKLIRKGEEKTIKLIFGNAFEKKV